MNSKNSTSTMIFIGRYFLLAKKRRKKKLKTNFSMLFLLLFDLESWSFFTRKLFVDISRLQKLQLTLIMANSKGSAKNLLVWDQINPNILCLLLAWFCYSFVHGSLHCIKNFFWVKRLFLGFFRFVSEF